MLYQSLQERLLSGALQEGGLSQRALKRMLKETDFFAKLPRQLPQTRTVCAEVLLWCRPVMDQLCPEPEQGWLKECYDELSHRLYPDAARGPLQKGRRQALGFFAAVLSWFLERETDRFPYDPLTDVPAVTEEELSHSLIEGEYRRWLGEIKKAHFVALMRLGREIMPFDPASHTIGVHHLALHVARQAAKAGLPVDVPLVSAAALSHDVGKFGCRGDDAKRIPYLHYYYTYQWLERKGLPKIAHIAANHSTWDLEFENLTLESLLLIYADFRVRGTRENGAEVVRIYTLEESYGMILSKLADVTPEKTRRYQIAYTKLADFEQMLVSRGVCTAPDSSEILPKTLRQPALLGQNELPRALSNQMFENNIRLMYMITKDVTFGQMLEQARGEKNLHRIRTYLRVFEEYNTYMTGQNKRRTLALLYELLTHHQGDVRRRSAIIMGQILANSGPKYRKELPASAPVTAMVPATAAFLAESVQLWEQYMDMCLYPDHKIAAKHALRISNSLKIIVASLVRNCETHEIPHFIDPLLDRLPNAEADALFALVDALYYIPFEILTSEQIGRLLTRLLDLLPAEEPLAVLTLRRLETLAPYLNEGQTALLRQTMERLPDLRSFAVAYVENRIRRLLQLPCRPLCVPVAQLYLSNLKNAVHWMVKLTQIDALADDLNERQEHAFHTAMHLSNLLCVSEHLPVRERAGRALLQMQDRLSVEEQNEIIVDLLRELETGQDEISAYIPRYLGVMIARLPAKELNECLEFLEGHIRQSSARTAGACLSTVSRVLETLAEPSCEQADRLLGLLLAGVSHYDDTIHDTALTVLCEDVLANEKLPREIRRGYYFRAGKKLLSLLSEPREGRFTFFTMAAMLNRVYRFLVDCRIDGADFRLPRAKPVAFFPGTFDPFSTGHKRVVEEILARGFEVYLAIDEFSWSKLAIPKLQRRQIASMSVADRMDVYLFPDEIPINIAYPSDLALLKSLFPERELWLVTGSDVIEGASAYRNPMPGSAADYDHIIFLRDSSVRREEMEARIRGRRIMLTLPEFYETVSSTRIRDYVDKNMDVSMLVDPMVQSYIYEKNLYLRAPQFKQEMQRQSVALDFKWDEQRCAATLLRTQDGTALARADGRTIRSTELYGVLGSLPGAEYLRRHSSGRMLLIEAVTLEPDADMECARRVLTELLARSLPEDHTYALCPTAGKEWLTETLTELGFMALPEQPDVLAVDMRTPVILVQDVLRRFKEPHRSDELVRAAVLASRPRLRRTICDLFPGKLLLSFDAELLDAAVMERVRFAAGVQDAREPKTLGKSVCVPYGSILSGEIVPNVVTKSLHVDKAYENDIYHFRIRAFPGYSDLSGQVRTIRAFHRPVLLVDDLLHKGYRLEKLDRIFRQEQLEIQRIVVGILSGRGRDLMQLEQREVDCEYFIPNLRYWFTESLLYPFIGGDSVTGGKSVGGLLPTENLILPYCAPDYLRGVDEQSILALSETCLHNAHEILLALEQCHQRSFGTQLTLGRMAEALIRPRAPYRGRHLQYDLSALPSGYVSDDIESFRRLRRTHL